MKNIFWGILLLMTTLIQDAQSETIPSFGYAPKSFPRDPLEVNQFAEHMLLGQILLPLVDTDQSGNLVPAVAKKWSFGKNGKTITFEINLNLKYSNGSNLKAEDILYTLQRHINSNSQSKTFLKNIKNIEIVSKDAVKISLLKIDVGIIKALSRDHLGIVPNGWKFDSQSNSPFVGMGAYNLERINNEWFLIANKYFKDSSNVEIKKIKLAFYIDDSFSIDTKNIPEIVPLISKKTLDSLKNDSPETYKHCSIAEEMTFSQSSLWWNPKSKFFNDENTRLRVFSFLDTQLKRISINQIKLATGFIPVGVMGYIPIRREIAYSNDESKIIKIKISSIKGLYEQLFTDKNFIEAAKNKNLQFSVQYITPLNVKIMHEEFKPDITIGSWGGGFNDPTGFLGPLEEDIGMPFEEYLGNQKDNFLKAQETQDWSERSKIFNRLAIHLVDSAFMLPGFRNDQFSCVRPPYTKKDISIRYTPRLINYKNGNK